MKLKQSYNVFQQSCHRVSFISWGFGKVDCNARVRFYNDSISLITSDEFQTNQNGMQLGLKAVALVELPIVSSKPLSFIISDDSSIPISATLFFDASISVELDLTCSRIGPTNQSSFFS